MSNTTQRMLADVDKFCIHSSSIDTRTASHGAPPTDISRPLVNKVEVEENDRFSLIFVVQLFLKRQEKRPCHSSLS
jgi:hypothetical protein